MDTLIHNESTSGTLIGLNRVTMDDLKSLCDRIRNINEVFCLFRDVSFLFDLVEVLDDVKFRTCRSSRDILVWVIVPKQLVYLTSQVCSLFCQREIVRMS